MILGLVQLALRSLDLFFDLAENSASLRLLGSNCNILRQGFSTFFGAGVFGGEELVVDVAGGWDEVGVAVTHVLIETTVPFKKKLFFGWFEVVSALEVNGGFFDTVFVVGELL